MGILPVCFFSNFGISSARFFSVFFLSDTLYLYLLTYHPFISILYLEKILTFCSIYISKIHACLPYFLLNLELIQQIIFCTSLIAVITVESLFFSQPDSGSVEFLLLIAADVLMLGVAWFREFRHELFCLLQHPSNDSLSEWPLSASLIFTSLQVSGFEM